MFTPIRHFLFGNREAKRCKRRTILALETLEERTVPAIPGHIPQSFFHPPVPPPAGPPPPSSISGFVYCDQNDNGQFEPDAGENGIAGVTVTLKRGARIVASTTTLEDGSYTFQNLRPGVYRIVETQPPGVADGRDTLGTVNGVVRGRVINNDVMRLGLPRRGVQAINYNFGEICHPGIVTEFVTIEGRKFEDRNGDGSDNGHTDPGWGGITVHLYADTDGDLALSADDLLIAQATTAVGTGHYSFSLSLQAGLYFVQEVVPAGAVQTNPQGPAYYEVSVPNTTAVTGLDFGNYQVSTIAGAKFNDLNGDGTWQSGEAFLANWTIQLWQGGDLVAQTTTDEGGKFVFTDLAPGTYDLREVNQDGWMMTSVTPAPITLLSGTTSEEHYIGNFRLGAIAGYKFNDLDNNGQKGANEPYLAGVTIFLDASGNGTLDADEEWTTTDALGYYCFNDLGPDQYLVREVEPEGFTWSTPLPPEIDLQSGAVWMAVTDQVPVGAFQTAQVMSELAIGNHQPSLGVVYTQGYWKNHEDVWPVTSLTLGTVTYTQAQLLTIFDTAVVGNGLVSLAHQLIAAKLNIANGADPTILGTTIADADALIGSLVIPSIGTGSLAPAGTSALTTTLDTFNNGTLPGGPPHG